MHDVARLAKVAVSTVSALINGAPRVSEARAERIRAAMRKLDYHPDQIARSLKVGRTQTIGVVVPDITNLFYPQVIRGIEDAAHAAGYAVLLCNSNEDPLQEAQHLSTLYSRRVDGVVLACSIGSGAADSTLRRRLPMVFVDRVPEGPEIEAVCTDNLEAGKAAARYLIQLGHRRIALLGGDLEISTHAQRASGFRAALRSARIALPREYLCVGGMRVSDGRAWGDHLLALEEPPTAVIASNSKLLLGLLDAMADRGVSAPRGLSVLSFDEHEWTELLRPRLTAIVQESHAIGQRGFELLRERIENPGHACQGVLKLPATLHVRESCATAPPVR